MDSPEFYIEEFMKNNEKLPRYAIEDIQRGLVKPRQKLTELDAKIKELCNKRAQVQMFIAQYDCVLSPIRQLPADILHNIFDHCLPTRRDPIMSAKEAPVLLTHVCRAWRQIAHASPRLWARLYITFSEEDNQPIPPSEKQLLPDMLSLRCSAIEEWLSRSGAQPLSISFCYATCTKQTPGNSDNTRRLLRILAGFSTRWRTIELTMPAEIYRMLERMVSISQLSMLNSIRATFIQGQNQYSFNPSGNELEVALLQAPNIQRISLTFYPRILRSAHWQSYPSLKNLTTLSFHWIIPVNEALSFLRN